MAPFDNPSTAKLTAKISPIFTNTMPEFVVTDHPIFIDFLKTYYQFLEAAELRLTVTIDNLALETSSANNLLDEEEIRLYWKVKMEQQVNLLLEKQ